MTTPEFIFSAAERNKTVIYQAIEAELAAAASVLEIGAGAASHAKYFCARQPHLRWQLSEHPETIELTRQALAQGPLPASILPPCVLDVTDQAAWPAQRFDLIYSANTLHIMPWSAVQAFFAQLPLVLAPEGRVIIYGPFLFDDQRPSNQSNQAFSRRLQAMSAHSAVREVEALRALAHEHGLVLGVHSDLPANNTVLRFTLAPSRGSG